MLRTSKFSLNYLSFFWCFLINIVKYSRYVPALIPDFSSSNSQRVGPNSIYSRDSTFRWSLTSLITTSTSSTTSCFFNHQIGILCMITQNVYDWSFMGHHVITGYPFFSDSKQICNILPWSSVSMFFCSL